jgi:hypothetical protein
VQAPAVLEGWHPICAAVAEPECSAVAAAFVTNLGRSWVGVQNESGGLIAVTPRPICPPLPDWAVPAPCWQASATTMSGRVCMVFARQDPAVADGASGFGQVGGDAFGRPPEPDDRPACV